MRKNFFFFVLLAFSLVLCLSYAQDKPKTYINMLTGDGFPEVIKKPSVNLVFFTSESCKRCRFSMGALKYAALTLHRKNSDMAINIIDVGEFPEIQISENITSLPAIRFYKDNKQYTIETDRDPESMIDAMEFLEKDVYVQLKTKEEVDLFVMQKKDYGYAVVGIFPDGDSSHNTKSPLYETFTKTAEKMRTTHPFVLIQNIENIKTFNLPSITEGIYIIRNFDIYQSFQLSDNKTVIVPMTISDEGTTSEALIHWISNQSTPILYRLSASSGITSSSPTLKFIFQRNNFERISLTDVSEEDFYMNFMKSYANDMYSRNITVGFGFLDELVREEELMASYFLNLPLESVPESLNTTFPQLPTIILEGDVYGSRESFKYDPIVIDTAQLEIISKTIRDNWDGITDIRNDNIDSVLEPYLRWESFISRRDLGLLNQRLLERQCLFDYLLETASEEKENEREKEKQKEKDTEEKNRDSAVDSETCIKPQSELTISESINNDSKHDSNPAEQLDTNARTNPNAKTVIFAKSIINCYQRHFQYSLDLFIHQYEQQRLPIFFKSDPTDQKKYKLSDLESITTESMPLSITGYSFEEVVDKNDEQDILIFIRRTNCPSCDLIEDALKRSVSKINSYLESITNDDDKAKEELEHGKKVLFIVLNSNNNHFFNLKYQVPKFPVLYYKKRDIRAYNEMHNIPILDHVELDQESKMHQFQLPYTKYGSKYGNAPTRWVESEVGEEDTVEIVETKLQSFLTLYFPTFKNM